MSKYLDQELLKHPFDQYQRYRLVAEVLDRVRNPGEQFEVLEVGGLRGLARKFLDQDQVMVSDLFSEGESLDILAGAETLPFPDRSFPVVLATDFLEHLRPQARPAAIQEMARTSSEMVLISAPFQYALAREAERMVFDFIKDWLGYEHKYLKEHLEFPAPVLAETEAELVKAGFDTVILPNGQLERWFLMVMAYYYFEAFPSAMAVRRELSQFYNKHWFWKDLAEPAYRYLIVASRKRLREKPEALRDFLEKKQMDPEPEYEKLKLWLESFRAGEARRVLQRISGLEEASKDKDDEIKHLKAYISELEDFHQKVKGSLGYRIYSRLFKGN